MTTTLYDRLGATEGVARLVDDLVEAHMRNPVIRARFLPYRADPARLAEIKARTCEFLYAGAGPVAYSGRSMPEAHRGMNIGDAEYVAALDDILETLLAHGIDEETRRDVLAIAYSLKDEIVRR